MMTRFWEGVRPFTHRGYRFEDFFTVVDDMRSKDYSVSYRNRQLTCQS